MSLPFKDISYAQGAYNMATNPDQIIVMKMSGAYTVSKACYYDSQAGANYVNAVKAGKAIGMYHFAGGGDPKVEADFFVKAVSPLAENDVLILDWEIAHSDPVGWCLAFCNEVFNRTSVWPLVYLNISTTNAYNWSPVLSKCGLWIAAPSYAFNASVPIKYPYVAQQGPIVGGVDTDMWFGTLEQFKKYGYHKPVVAPAPTPVPAPTPAPAPVPIPAPVPATDSPLDVENNSLLKQILALLNKIAAWLHLT